jgi:predicted RNA binding protein YcfA (HicA-like mRNA interferase family)
MASDPAVSGKDAVRALKKLGFRLDRVEGSHSTSGGVNLRAAIS